MSSTSGQGRPRHDRVRSHVRRRLRHGDRCARLRGLWRRERLRDRPDAKHSRTPRPRSATVAAPSTQTTTPRTLRSARRLLEIAAAPCSVPLSLSINDVSANETNAGTTTFSFTVSLSAPAAGGGVSFDIATADDTATVGDNDYVASSLAGQAIPEGSSTYQFDVTVNGDTGIEANESFFVNVTNVSGATVADGQGQGTIQNDDSNPCDDPFTPIFLDPGKRLDRRTHRHADHRGRRGRRLRGNGRKQRVLHPGPDRRRRRCDLRWHLRLHRLEQHRRCGRLRPRHRIRPRAFHPDRHSTGPTATRRRCTDILDCGTGSVADDRRHDAIRRAMAACPTWSGSRA